MDQLSPEFKIFLNQVWEYLAPDLISSIESLYENKGKVISIPQYEVCEVVLDASRLELYLQDRLDDNLSQELRDFRKLSWQDQIKLAKTVFIYKGYGW